LNNRRPVQPPDMIAGPRPVLDGVMRLHGLFRPTDER
jgi:hypothetical protein